MASRLGIFGYARGDNAFSAKTPAAAWAVGQQFNKEIFNPLPRLRKKRKPHLTPYSMMDAVIDNSPINVAPYIAQPDKPRGRGLLGQGRFAKSMGGGSLDPRGERNAQRFAGTSDWLAEGLTLGYDQRLWSHRTTQSVVATSAASAITATLVTSGIVLCHPSTYGLALTLPDVKTWTSDVTIKNRTGYTSTIAIFGYTVAQRIDGARSVSISQAFDWITLHPDGSHWWIVG